MAYTPPAGDILELLMTGAYTPPAGDGLVLNMGPPTSTLVAASRAGAYADCPLVAASRGGAYADCPLVAESRGGYFSYNVLVATSREGYFSYNALVTISREGAYALPLDVSRQGTYRISLAAGRQGIYGVTVSVERQGNHVIFFPAVATRSGNFSILTPHAFSHAEQWRIWDGIPLSTRHQGLFGVQVGAHRSGNYFMPDNVATSRVGKYPLLDFEPVIGRRQGDYAVHSGEVQVITGQPTMTHEGVATKIISAEITTSDSDYAWMARVVVARQQDFQRMVMGDSIVLNLYGEEFHLVVDSLAMARANAGVDLAFNVQAVSSLIMPRAPVSLTWEGVVNARTAVEQLLGVATTWTLPDWGIPASRLAAVLADPLFLAQQIVGAAGGVVEAMPSGAISCRPRFPISVPAWPTDPADHVIIQREMVGESESFRHVEIVNRIAIADVDQQGGDEVSFTADPADPNKGIIRVYPNPWNENRTIVHTGHPGIAISPRGVQERQETEIIRFEHGVGYATYPVLSITSSSWQYGDLGAVACDGSKSVTSAESGFSLLSMTYTTRCLEWDVMDDRDEEILFLVMG